MMDPKKITKRSNDRFLYHMKKGDNPAIITYSGSTPMILKVSENGTTLEYPPIGTILKPK